MKILAVSLAFPPLAYPRSIQVARLLRHLDAETVLFCGDEPAARRDETIEPKAETALAGCIRVPVRTGRLGALINGASHRFARSVWNRRNLVPDHYSDWGRAVVGSVERYLAAGGLKPDRIVTFAQPFTDHLIGLKLKERFGIPWLAYSSDPWTDNPFAAFDKSTHAANLKLEGAVTERADALVFTSTETVDLYFRKYPSRLREKAGVIPQCYDAEQFKTPALGAEGKVIVRYLGNFYGKRTPTPLVQALQSIAENSPATLDNLRIELIGAGDTNEVERVSSSLPTGLLSAKDSVNYSESLDLMSSSDGLLLIDAPAELSVFLPSKLIDYIGSGKPVFGITPPGTAASLIGQLGGSTSAPSDIGTLSVKLNNFILDLKAQKSRQPTPPWGDPDVRKQFAAPRIADDFRKILEKIGQ